MQREELNTLAQIAKRMDVTTRTVQRLIAEGRLTAVCLNDKRRAVKESDYQAFIASLPVVGSAAKGVD